MPLALPSHYYTAIAPKWLRNLNVAYRSLKKDAVLKRLIASFY
jgi:hypothetical protein